MKRMAQRFAEQGQRGWLTPAARTAGLELGGHEKAALAHIEQHRSDLCNLLYAERHSKGFATWEETDGTDLIKNFAVRHGFVRVAAD